MKKTGIISVLLFIGGLAFAQDKAAADQLVSEGVTLHDKGDYSGAIAKYDKALAADKDNLSALAEKAYSLNSLLRYEESIKICELAVEKHPGEKDLQNVYATWGNALDILKRPDESIEVYNEGIKHFPGFYLLHFNKGITLTVQNQYAEAMPCFQQALKLNPEHAGSHNAVARLAHMRDKRIPALLAYCRFLCIEPEGGRAEKNLQNLKTLVQGNVEVKGKKNVTINIDASIFGDTLPNGEHAENNFATADMLLSLTTAMEQDKKNKKKAEVELFIGKMETLFTSLGESREGNSGFFWEYYAPYFIEMQEKKLTETFGYIAFASSGDAGVNKWIKNNQADINRFFEWSEAYAWPGN